VVLGIPAMVALPAGIWLARHHMAGVTAALSAGIWLAGHHLAGVTAALAGGPPSA
jgi:hypothetical protein